MLSYPLAFSVHFSQIYFFDMPSMIVANWKMNLSHQESLMLARAIAQHSGSIPDNRQVVICPSFLSLIEVGRIIEKTSIALGAQNVFWEDVGAYTGEISPLHLKEAGCRYVIVGHSERRRYLREDNSQIHKKTKAALQAGLIPIICVGEDWEERAQGQKDYILIQQVTEILQGIHLRKEQGVIIAYEPVWAISTGRGIYADPEEVQYAVEVIRQVLLDLYDQDISRNTFRVLYGGSVSGENVSSFSRLKNVDGVLVGSASQKAEDFFRLIQNTL